MPKKTDPLEDLANAYQACFTTPAGQKVLADLDRVHYKRSCSTKKPEEYYLPHEVQVRAGEQTVAMRIHDMIDLAEIIRRDKLEEKAAAEAKAKRKPEPGEEPDDYDESEE